MVVVVVILAVLLLAGAFSSNKSNGTIADPTFSQAADAVKEWAANYDGGGWKTFVASGLDSSVATISPPINGSTLSGLTKSESCMDNILIPSGSTVTLPAYSGNVSSGESPIWVFVMFNSSATFLAVEDNSGTITPLATIACSELALVAAILSPIPSNVIDSSAAATTAWDSGGRAFAALNPNATVEMGLVSGLSLLGTTTYPIWTVTYQACNPSSVTTSPVATFTAEVNATLSSQNLISANNTTSACGVVPELSSSGLGGIGGIGGVGGNGGTIPLSSDISFGTPLPAVSSTGQYSYTLLVTSAMTSASAVVDWDELAPLLEYSNGTLIFLPTGNLTVDNVYGVASAVYNFSGFGWDPGAYLPITTSQELVVNSGTMDMSGDRLVLESLAFGVTGNVTIPDL
ncbi:MAG: hypothetical protein L3K03_01110 [Thermoplasmata archaeon]|nr:hypothetical protein [Thermoplasmata archaeon]